MKNLNLAVYAEGCFGPSELHTSTIAQLRKSGFTTLILGLFHIGRDYDIDPPQITGDLYFNNTLVISEGVVQGTAWAALINTVPGGTVSRVCASIGGGGVMDYETIQKIYIANNHSFAGTNLETNLQALKTVFPAITVIDMDCEETYDQSSFVAFCQMLAGIGFGISFCPYATWEESFWTGSLAALNSSNPGAVAWWNLQCYDGGAGNDPATWAAAITTAIPGFNTDGYILAGDWTNDSPSAVQTLFSGFATEPCVGGGFIWTLDDIIKAYPSDPLSGMQAYADAISVALAGGVTLAPVKDAAE